MGVDWYPCKSCEEVFCDCGDYTRCECGERWCSLECAEDDGYVVKVNIQDDDETSCDFCRGEDFTDTELLNYLLKSVGFTREEAVEHKIKRDKEETMRGGTLC